MRALIFLLLIITSPICQAGSAYTGKVIHISDGDAIKISVGQQQIKIKLAEIDAPEKGQPYNNKARKALGNLIFGKVVTIKELDKDRIGRIVGKVYLGNLYINAWMVEHGHAWVNREYSNDPFLSKLEDQARNSKQGLWSSDHRVPPWQWHQPRSQPGNAQGQKTNLERPQCAVKTSCKEMLSCNEAMTFFKLCGQTHLDSDGDGIPCEKLCK